MTRRKKLVLLLLLALPGCALLKQKQPDLPECSHFIACSSVLTPDADLEQFYMCFEYTDNNLILQCQDECSYGLISLAADYNTTPGANNLTFSQTSECETALPE